MSTYYGFSISNRSEQPAWFHSKEAALRFAAACGFTTGDDQRPLTLDDVESTDNAAPDDVMDTPDQSWTGKEEAP